MPKYEVLVTIDAEANRVNLRFADTLISMSPDEAAQIAAFLLRGATQLEVEAARERFRSANEQPKSE